MENMRHALSEYLKSHRLIADGSFGTYYADKYQTDEFPELANGSKKQDRAYEIHKEYIEAGARLIRTNTFASNSAMFGNSVDGLEENIKSAVASARRANPIFIAGDIGPLSQSPESAGEEYYNIGKIFVNEGIDILNFETMPSLLPLLLALKRLKEDAAGQKKPLFIIVQFCVNQFGYSAGGVSARKLIEQAAACEWIDAVGLNCGVGPAHMERIVANVDTDALNGKYFAVMPNAGYPKRTRNKIRFESNPEYFAQKAAELADKCGADIVGGCCGTAPEDIRQLTLSLGDGKKPQADTHASHGEKASKPTSYAFFDNRSAQSKKRQSDKLIAVELAPPVNADDEKVLEAARLLADLGVDVLTFPDSPSGRTRVDSVLMAAKVRRETDVCVMPHICCRDKNAIAMRSVFLGAHINDIHNFLIVTGDPVPTAARQTTKAVFNFDSVGLMGIADEMNEESFKKSPLVYGGAINQGRKNLDVEIGRVKKKLEAGAEFFMTQPIFTREAADRVRRIKKETNARILCGIMPLISRKNALFMQNEIAGVEVPDDVVARYPEGGSREDGEAAGVALAVEMIRETSDFADGYYFSFPFNRVYLLERILGQI